ncbi:serine acetyltransferase [Candidatus Scalindua japonica]|uniref:Serine acetyltransferase n=2 Tax=Candidatus Scalindua japonica TaxID=1284222 RepID=A0A286U465_9BACT|nr:serine acetyltransferase [Candidatus Scalindua japonica]
MTVRLLFSCWCPATAIIGKNTSLGYGGLGVVIGSKAIIGNNVELGSGVVVGGNATEAGDPVIEDDVYIGAGAKILGPIRLGKGCLVAANAVVVKDVSSGCVVGGVPAKVLKEEIDINSFLYHRQKRRNT